MRSSGINVFRIGGIQIVIDISWFVVFFLVAIMMAQNYFPQERDEFSAADSWLLGFASAVLIFVSVLLHELGHSFVALAYGVRVVSIRLFIFGGVAQIESEPSAARHEFLIALAGPATSMALAVGFAAASGAVYAFGGPASLYVLAGSVSVANLMLALFNLVPGLPLDGGRILRAFLWDHWNDLERATKVVSQLGNVVAIFLVVVGALQFFLTQNLVSGIWLAFIGFVMKQSAVASYQNTVMKQTLSGVKVCQVMTADVVTVDWLTSVEDLVRDYIYKRKFKTFPVLYQNELLGMVSLFQVKSIPKELWTFKQVRDIMTPIDKVAILRPSDDAAEALNRLTASDTGRMPVIEDGRLVGLVSRSDIMSVFRIKSDLGVA